MYLSRTKQGTLFLFLYYLYTRIKEKWQGEKLGWDNG
jgi:hypothetical protein